MQNIFNIKTEVLTAEIMDMNPKQGIVTGYFSKFNNVDADGDIVCGIPFSMRSMDTPNNETLIYSIAYYETEVAKALGEPFPENSINGKKIIYVRP